MIEQMCIFSILTNPALIAEVKLDYHFFLFLIRNFIVNPPINMSRPWHVFIYFTFEITPLYRSCFKLTDLYYLFVTLRGRSCEGFFMKSYKVEKIINIIKEFSNNLLWRQDFGSFLPENHIHCDVSNTPKAQIQ